MPHHVRQLYRLVVVGGERVGKTAIIEQLIFGNHVLRQGGLPTIGDIYEVALETEKGIVERLQIFDTPGSLFASTKNFSEQDHFVSIADGVLLVYEITSKASYDLVVSARQKIALRNKDLPMVLLGNKSDLSAIREVDNIRAQTWARSHGIRPYEVTVINRDSLKDPFCYITWRMANPSKPFSAIPILTSTTGFLTNTQTPYTRLAGLSQQLDRQEARTDLSSSASAIISDTSSSSAAASAKLNESQSDVDFDTGAKGIPLTSLYPSDAKYPGKHGAATLFLADCLSSKHKEKHGNH